MSTRRKALMCVIPLLLVMNSCSPYIQISPGFELELVTIRTIDDDLYIDYYVLAQDNSQIWFSREPGQRITSAERISIAYIKGIYRNGENITKDVIKIDPHSASAEYLKGIRDIMAISLGLSLIGAILINALD